MGSTSTPTSLARSWSRFAHQALERLQGGEASLAVSPLCGTNIAVAGILAGAGSYLAIESSRKGGLDAISRAITVGMLAVLASQPLGRLVQKHYTTSPDLEGVRIVSVEPVGNGSLGVHKVRTAAGLSGPAGALARVDALGARTTVANASEGGRRGE